ncbi:MAG: thiamine phosphate synthase, partial [Cyclobacteriaceae bacterium]
LLINDNVKLAQEIKAGGVHLGKNDIDADKARAILGKDFIIGGTANSFDDIVRLNEWKVDYIGLGPFRLTETKENLSPTLGKEGYQGILESMKAQNIDIPVVAIGGILAEDVPSLLGLGLHGIAISGGISKAEDVEKAAIEFITLTDQ